ncbi:unnamed protein product [Amoebophrya sp. A25]|nr:unnamed protein product [Amoebophrya sp. A25]|eukprot:GSA25T00024479001.1
MSSSTGGSSSSSSSGAVLGKTSTSPTSGLVDGGSILPSFATYWLEIDAGLVHFCFVCGCMCVVLSRGSVQGFSARTQGLLLLTYLCNCALRQLSTAYWWIWTCVLGQGCLCILFYPNLRKYGLGDATERTLVASALALSVMVGLVHYEYADGADKILDGWLPAEHYGLLGDGSFQERGRRAVASANLESALRSVGPGTVAFIVGFKRALESLALLPQYRACFFSALDWRVYSWTATFGAYELYLSAFYFGRFHLLTLVQAASFFYFLASGGIRVSFSAPQTKELHTKALDHAELSEIRGLMEEPNAGTYDVL